MRVLDRAIDRVLSLCLSEESKPGARRAIRETFDVISNRPFTVGAIVASSFFAARCFSEESSWISQIAGLASLAVAPILYRFSPPPPLKLTPIASGIIPEEARLTEANTNLLSYEKC